METIRQLISFILHVDQHLDHMIQTYDAWTYAILMAIIFLETGVVFTPFLPGDSLIFAAGVFGARGALNPHLVFVLLASAAILGDNCNYAIGRFLGKRLVGSNSRFLKKEYLDKTHAYFEKYGAATIILARFVPIVRTFSPFVAGIGAMTYRRFLPFDILGGIIWVGVCNYAGFFLGGIDAIRKNFELTVLVIIAVSILPAVVEVVRHKLKARAAAKERAGVPLEK